MKRKKENILVIHKRENGDSMCLCKEILWLKFQNLDAECKKLREETSRQIVGSKRHQSTLNHLIKQGNKRRALTELYHEIIDAESCVRNMIEIPIDDERTVYRVSEGADRRRSCKNKVKHSSLQEAEIAAAEITEKRQDEFNAYKCRHCDFWHVGHSLP